MNEQKKLDDVIDYWNRNPVHSVEFKQFNDIKKYCEDIDQLRWNDNERWSKGRFYDFQTTEKVKLLDAGCGIGVFTRYYAKKGFEVHAIDITSKAVEITKKSLDAFDLHAEVNVGNVEAIDYPEDYFDYLVSNGVIHHTPDTEKAVKEFYRVLKPGGIASVCVYYRNVLLRQPLWFFVRLALPLFLKKNEGREKFFLAKTPEDFVRVYDGNNTPIAIVYTREEADELFSPFKILAAEPHYFPIRFLRLFKVGGHIHKILDRSCGTLIYYLLQKPLESKLCAPLK